MGAIGRVHSLSDGEEPPNTAPTAVIAILVDNTAPSGSIAPSEYIGGATATVAGTATDSGSGVAGWQLQIAATGSSEWASVCSSSKPVSGSEYQCSFNATGYAEAAYKLRAVVTDNAGNTYTTSVAEVMLDNTAPTGTLAPASESGYGRGTLTLEGTAGDARSGVASWTPQIASAGGSSWSNACSPQTTPVSGSTYRCTINSATYADGGYRAARPSPRPRGQPLHNLGPVDHARQHTADRCCGSARTNLERHDCGKGAGA